MPNPAELNFLAGGGQMGAEIRAHDWRATTLGVPGCWPLPLRTVVGIMLRTMTPVAIYWGPEFALLYNDAWRSLIGDRHPEALGKPAKLVFPESWNDIESVFAATLSGGSCQDVRDQSLPPHRLERDPWLAYSLSPILLEDGSAGGILNIANETTALVQARTAHRADVARHRQIIDSATESAIIALDLQGRVTRWNAGAQHITGWSEPEMLGETIGRIFTPEDIAAGRVQSEMRTALAQGSSADRRWYLRKDGGRFYADGEMRPILGADASPIGLVKAFSNRTIEHEGEQRRTLLTQASAGLLAADEPDDELALVLQQGAELLGFDQSYGFALTADGEHLRLTHSIGVTEQVRGELGHAPFDGPICGIVAETGRPLILCDLQRSSDPRYALGRVSGLQAYAGFPLLVKGKLYGVLSFGSISRAAFDEEAISFFGTLARFLAVVRARLDNEASLRELNHTLEQRVADRTRERDRIWQVSQDMLGVTDERGVWLSINPAWTRILGWSAEQIVGKSAAWLQHPDDRAATQTELARLAAGHTTLGLENRFQTTRGDFRLLNWTAVPFEGRFYCVGRDVTEERERAAALRDAMDFSRLALSAVGGVGAWTYDVTDDRYTCDAAIAELYCLDPARGAAGFKRQEFLAHVHPDDCARLTENMADGRGDSGDMELEYRICHPDGSVRWILSRGHTYCDAEGRPARRIGIGIETTKQRLLEEQLRQSQKMEAVGQLTGGLAHDFNNLLTGITGSLELLKTRLAQGRLDQIDRYLSTAQGAANRAAALTHRLLAFSRRQTLEPKATNANRLIAGMEDIIRRTVGPAIEVETVAAADAWPILVDPNQLENALLNLCINARDAMPEGGKLTIRTANRWFDDWSAQERDLPAGEYLSLCVSDSGTGMTPDVADRAFDPFFTTKPIGQGTGLGLSMIYGFVRQSGGQVRIYSEVGHGARVCLYLPRLHDASDESAAPSHELAGAPRATQGQTVLVVDDEPSVLMLVAEVLDELGYVAIEAADGVTGLKVLQSDARVDLLVTDVGLPGGMNGRQMADAARLLRPDLKVLFITGYAETAVITAGQLAPGMHVLAKPFALEVLASRIKELLNDV